MTMPIPSIAQLEAATLNYKKKLLTLAHVSGGMHVGGDLSLAEILVALYYRVMKVDPKNPNWPGRDYFVLSKGHCAGGLFTVLADMGFFDEDELRATYQKLDAKYGMHPCRKAVGVETATGSLGHGLSITNGMALAAKLDGADNTFYCVLGDGECHEGSVWEAAMSAAQFKLDNVVAIIDRNGLSLDGFTEEIMALEPLDKKWESFGWNVAVVDGHDMDALVSALEAARQRNGKPNMIIAKTVKGHSISFMENDPDWHAGTVDSEMLKKCCAILDAAHKAKGEANV
jgi:transketolase